MTQDTPNIYDIILNVSMIYDIVTLTLVLHSKNSLKNKCCYIIYTIIFFNVIIYLNFMKYNEAFKLTFYSIHNMKNIFKQSLLKPKLTNSYYISFMHIKLHLNIWTLFINLNMFYWTIVNFMIQFSVYLFPVLSW